MENFYLETPKLNRKYEALEYLKENSKYDSSFNGTGGMEKCLEDITYEEWLLELEKKKTKENLNNFNKCPSKTFFLIRENDNKIVGMVNIRYNITEEQLKTWASHIGYGIRPTERQKGYSKIALYLGLLEEQKIKEDKVLLICDVDNIGSNKTILSLGGVLEKTKIYEYDNKLTNYYSLNVNDSIEKYCEYYKDYIKCCSKINK